MCVRAYGGMVWKACSIISFVFITSLIGPVVVRVRVIPQSAPARCDVFRKLFPHTLTLLLINSLLLPSCIVLSRIIMNHLFSSLLLLVVATFGIIASVEGFATPSLQQLGGISGGKVLRQPFFCEHPKLLSGIFLYRLSLTCLLCYTYI